MIVPTIQAMTMRLDGERWPDPIKGNLRIYATNAIGFFLMYFYFGFGFADGNASCWASEESWEREDPDPKGKETLFDGYHDVGASFRGSFKVLFILTVI